MEIIKGIKQLKTKISESVVTIGSFDGVHLGHYELIQKALKKSKELGLTSVVVTFRPHPVEVLRPDIKFQRLCSYTSMYDKLEKLGIDHLIEEPFTKELSERDALDYFENFIEKPLNLKALYIGYDFSFGKNQSGDFHFLEKQSQLKGFYFERISPIKVNGETISSTGIRKKLSVGDVSGASEWLGYPYFVVGEVVKGDQRGRTIGFRTANLAPEYPTYLPTGVYITQLTCLDSGETYNSITNIGTNPTFKEGVMVNIKIETHIFNFDKNIYSQRVRLSFFKFLREEKKFSKIEELVEQIQEDIKTAQWYFEEI